MQKPQQVKDVIAEWSSSVNGILLAALIVVSSFFGNRVLDRFDSMMLEFSEFRLYITAYIAKDTAELQALRRDLDKHIEKGHKK